MGDHSFDGNELIAFPAEDCNANRATMAVMWAGLEVWFSKPHEAAIRALKEPAFLCINDKLFRCE